MRRWLAAGLALWAAMCPAAGCSRKAAIRKIPPDELKAMLDRKDDFVFVDVRRPEELQVMGTLPGYRNIPLDQIEARYAEIPRDRLVVLACNRAQRAARAAAILAAHGYQRLAICALNEYRERGYAMIHPKPGGGRAAD
jgi:rhodanese-related sulfurtransferase